jgi:hypothetical protein
MNHLAMSHVFEDVESVVVTFSDTGKTLVLTTRKGSSQHFFPKFVVGDDEIQLRLDWSDPDTKGRPTLDADFINRGTGRHRAVQGRREPAHHTAASLGDDRRYEWVFDGFTTKFTVAVTWRKTFSASLGFSGSLTAVVIPAGGRKTE